MWHSWSMENCFLEWLETTWESEVLSSIAGFAWSSTEPLCLSVSSIYIENCYTCPLIHSTEIMNSSQGLREPWSCHRPVKIERTVARRYQALPWLVAEASHTPVVPLTPVYSISKVARKMPVMATLTTSHTWITLATDETMKKDQFLSSSVLAGTLWHSLKVKKSTEVGGELLQNISRPIENWKGHTFIIVH